MAHHRVFPLASIACLLAACAGSGEPLDNAGAGTVETVADATATPPATPVPDTVPEPPTGPVLKLRFGSVTERNIDPQADGRNATAAIAGMNQFAVDLFTMASNTQPGNLVLSPYGITNTLGMLYCGAAGQTATEMAAVLHTDAPAADWHEGLNAYDLSLNARTAGSPTEWVTANKVWTQQGLALRDTYLDLLTGSYGSALAEANFAADADNERATINEWVAANTKDRIPELFPAGTITAQTVLALVNAVALDAPWEFPFNPASTSDQPFHRTDGTTVDVPTMHYDEYLPSLWTEQLQAVEIPYSGGALSMIVIMPQDLATFESTMTAANLDEIVGQITDGGIHLSIPKWTDRTHLQLNDLLSALGMASAFGAEANFDGMIEGGGLQVSTVEHEAFIEVDEAGTRAAAATGGAMELSHGPTITVDRPFVYLIRDQGAGATLFIGHMTDPSIG